MSIKYISSQRYIDWGKVQVKQEDKDFTVLVSPAFELEGKMVAVVMDGHHAYHAALESGESPEFVECGNENENIRLIDKDIEEFLMAVHCGDNYYFLETGIDIW